jgi:hypothetical protein
MIDEKPSKEDMHKVDSELGKQPKVEDQRNVDAKEANKPHMVVAPKVDLVTPKVDFSIEFTMERKFKQRGHIFSWVRDLAVKLGFVVVIAKSDNRGNGRKGYVTLVCQRDDQYREYVQNERGEKITLKSDCLFKVKSYLLSSKH